MKSSTKRKYSLLIKGALLVSCGLAMQTHAYEGEAPRPFDVQKYDNIGLEVWVPVSPAWSSTLQKRRDTQAVILSSPSLYYPRTIIEILFHKTKPINPLKLPTVALSAINEVRKSTNIAPTERSALISVTYDDITGFQNEFDIQFEGEEYTMQVFVGLFPNKLPITLTTTTPKGQINHISTMKSKIYRQLSVLAN